MSFPERLRFRVSGFILLNKRERAFASSAGYAPSSAHLSPDREITMIDPGFASNWTDADLPHLARLTAIGELVASLAHELNQPFTAIAISGEASLYLIWLDRLTCLRSTRCASI